ncbi:hypothetical protein HYALB_00013565 [Hymenoscyphus albidus]|uniref:SprT-like domain-containing protein n=1 Tax=Hymenoscyphus albidus TaxID=595503 RepID=A0A9N9M0Q3_9HELO|nr:hypothetical protein HYALB_00013565 [Hymenoscyphus albidus]
MFGSTLSHAGLKIELEVNRTIRAFGWFNRPSRTVFLNLDPALQTSPLMVGTREEHLISTMLHECVHAFIGIYSCNKLCCVIFRHPSQGGEGTEGHGPVWVDGYATVRKELAAHVPWAVENSLRRGVIGSMCDDLWQPSAEQVKRWELPEEIFGSPAGWGFARGDFREKVKKVHEKRRELHERDAPKQSAGKQALALSKVDEETKAGEIVKASFGLFSFFYNQLTSDK